VVRPVRLDEVEALFASSDLVVDACRRAVRGPARSVPLARRLILFALVGALAESLAGRRPPRSPHRARFLGAHCQRVASGPAPRRARPPARRSAPACPHRGDPGAASRSPQSTPPPSSCWPRRSTDPPGPSSPCSRVASRGRRPRSRVRSAPASEPSSGRCVSSKRRRQCAPSDAVAPAAGSRRHSADSRQPCYSQARCPSSSLGS
jgi:hypothetical protein